MSDMIHSEANIPAAKSSQGLASNSDPNGMVHKHLTDTGRNWGGKHSLRDSMPGAEPVPVETTDDLARWIGSAGAEELYMTVHPERWAMSEGEWVASYIKDLAMNAGKKVLLAMR
ncbi:hypothetical protein [Methanothrix soehngenii]